MGKGSIASVPQLKPWTCRGRYVHGLAASSVSSRTLAEDVQTRHRRRTEQIVTRGSLERPCRTKSRDQAYDQTTSSWRFHPNSRLASRRFAFIFEFNIAVCQVMRVRCLKRPSRSAKALKIDKNQSLALRRFEAPLQQALLILKRRIDRSRLTSPNVRGECREEGLPGACVRGLGCRLAAARGRDAATLEGPKYNQA